MDQDATLCLLSSMNSLLCRSWTAPPSYIDKCLSALREAGKKILAKAEAKVRKRGVKANAVLVETMGHRLTDVIIEQAKKWRADLIVLGTHGRRGLTRLVMGSDAEGVVRSTRVPVLLVRTPGKARPRGQRNSK